MSLTEAGLGEIDPGNAPQPEFHEVNQETTLHIIPNNRPLSQSELTLLERLHSLRLDFVVGMGWLPDAESDLDAYDADPGTHHFATVSPRLSETVTGGMRLTRVGSVQESLSWSMLNEAMADDASARVGKSGESLVTFLDTAASYGDLWDLTRLVAPLDGSITSEEARDNILMMVGAAFSASCGQAEDPERVQWLFTVTREMKVALDRLGIRSVALTKGRIRPEDKSDAYFCVVNPLEDMQYIHRNPGYEHTRDMVMRGLQKASAL